MSLRYPAFLDLRERNVLLIGGGKAALEKLPSLLQSGARIHLIASEITDAVYETIEKSNVPVKIELREIRLDDLVGRDVVFSATNSHSLNAQLRLYAQEKKIWINSVDDPENSDFVSASVLDRGSFRIAISTNGKFAGIAVILKKILDQLLPTDHMELFEELFAIRKNLKEEIKEPEERKRILARVLRSLQEDYFQSRKAG